MLLQPEAEMRYTRDRVRGQIAGTRPAPRPARPSGVLRRLAPLRFVRAVGPHPQG